MGLPIYFKICGYCGREEMHLARYEFCIGQFGINLRAITVVYRCKTCKHEDKKTYDSVEKYTDDLKEYADEQIEKMLE